MKEIIKLGTLSLLVSALLVGCGSSSSSSITENETPTAENTNEGTETTESTTALLTGYFIDAEVEGVEYLTTSGESGITDALGRFKYKQGDQVKLSIGNLVLGEVAPAENGLVTPATLAKGDAEVRTLLLRTLQALDSDNNSSNRITIPSGLLKDIAETEISKHTEETLLALDDTLTNSLDEDHDNVIDVSKDEAEKHFVESQMEWNNGKRPEENTQGQNEDNNATQMETHGQGGNDTGKGSNIGYLKQNHTNYAQHGSTTLTPSATQNAENKSIDWTIEATTEDGATKLADHINFMVGKLEEGKNPRGWDKLFLMEAYMKVNHNYTTSVEKTGTSVVISKVANTTCAYDVIAAHSDAVSGDFFAQGIIDKDNSPKAEEILASTSCDVERTAIEAYIVENIETKQ